MKNLFKNGKHFTNVTNVGELKELLAEVDDNMPIKQGDSDSVDVMIYHNMDNEPHLAFEEGDSN